MNLLKKHPLITGTLFLTFIGLINRVIGFFYRIYLTSLFGAEGMGILQLTTPILALSFALLAAGNQTAISKLCASYKAANTKREAVPFLCALTICLPLSFLFCILLYQTSDFVSCYLLHEPRTHTMIKICAFAIPLYNLHACFNGFLYGTKRQTIAALSGLAEQISKVGCVFLLNLYALRAGYTLSIHTTMIGLGIGELIAVCFCLISLYLTQRKTSYSTFSIPTLQNYRELFKITLPFTANRLSINLLLSLETTSVPLWLRHFGYPQDKALSYFGILTGMALPLLFFPNALTSAIATLLLPQISESQTVGNTDTVIKLTKKSITYSLCLGFVCSFLFFIFGQFLGNNLFHSALAGRLIVALSLLCPFLYLDTTLSGILHGLGDSGKLFLVNLTGLLLRLFILSQGIPRFGMVAYIVGIFVGEGLQCLFYLILLSSHFRQERS